MGEGLVGRGLVLTEDRKFETWQFAFKTAAGISNIIWFNIIFYSFFIILFCRINDTIYKEPSFIPVHFKGC